MRILITNDDGVHSEGIRVLTEAVRGMGETVVMAPAMEQSASSHSITLRDPLLVDRLARNVYSVDGTPTDCVVLSLNGVIGARPDLVVSGVNHGANMGDDVTYSGTVAAAIEAVLYGVPAIAFSVAALEGLLFEAPSRMIRPIVERMIARPRNPKTIWNVNFPNIPFGEVRGIRVTRLGTRFYENSVVEEAPRDGGKVFRIGGGKPTWKREPETDFQAVFDRYVSITPILLDLNDYESILTMREWEWSREGGVK
ncbi:MAG: 5'/3'-nucleotidase SurE [Candidatus Eisenbacteria bacterium]|nr:5'/3'-nucleotidase SurE [Candidatus Eisenbacteria bacterium]